MKKLEKRFEFVGREKRLKNSLIYINSITAISNIATASIPIYRLISNYCNK